MLKCIKNHSDLGENVVHTTPSERRFPLVSWINFSVFKICSQKLNDCLRSDALFNSYFYASTLWFWFIRIFPNFKYTRIRTRVCAKNFSGHYSIILQLMVKWSVGDQKNDLISEISVLLCNWTWVFGGQTVLFWQKPLNGITEWDRFNFAKIFFRVYAECMCFVILQKKTHEHAHTDVHSALFTFLVNESIWVWISSANSMQHHGWFTWSKELCAYCT